MHATSITYTSPEIPTCEVRSNGIAVADLEHNLGGGGGKSMQEVLAEPAGKGAGRCPLLRAKRGSFDFF